MCARRGRPRGANGPPLGGHPARHRRARAAATRPPRAALRRVGPGGPTTPGGIPPERRARRDTPAQAGALPRSLPPADGLKKTAWAGKGARPAWLCRDTCPALAPPPKGGDLPCCAAGAGPRLARSSAARRAGLPLCARPRGPARTQPRSGATEKASAKGAGL